jgi:hypothetical protein
MTLTEIRAQWRKEPCSTGLDWKTSPDQTGNERGQCQGEFVISDGFPYPAYLKPGKINQNALPWPAPAYEKISADFAYDLNCPVPVAQIWQREEGNTNGYACYSSLSLKEYPKKYPWNVCQQALADATAAAAAGKPDIVTPLAMAALLHTSGMLVLDTWLGQRDRGDHANNLALSYDPAEPSRSQFTYFDFAQTLNYDGQWADDKWQAVTVTQQPQLIMKNIQKNVVKLTYEKLMDMTEDHIGNTITRLACDYFKEANRIAECLIGRRNLLKPIIEPYMV